MQIGQYMWKRTWLSACTYLHITSLQNLHMLAHQYICCEYIHIWSISCIQSKEYVCMHVCTYIDRHTHTSDQSISFCMHVVIMNTHTTMRSMRSMHTTATNAHTRSKCTFQHWLVTLPRNIHTNDKYAYQQRLHTHSSNYETWHAHNIPHVMHMLC
jgi:hypothetical protein